MRPRIEEMTDAELAEHTAFCVAEMTNRERHERALDAFPGVRLTRAEAMVLAVLMDGRVHSPRSLYAPIAWSKLIDDWSECTAKTVAVHVMRLRRKIEGQPARIETVRGFGYRLVRDGAFAHG